MDNEGFCVLEQMNDEGYIQTLRAPVAWVLKKTPTEDGMGTIASKVFFLSHRCS